MGVLGIRRKRIEGEKPIYLTEEDILRDAQRDGFIKDYSLDIESLIKSKDISIRKVKMQPSESGRLFFENGSWVIEVNSQHNEKRQRFTMAHELAHFFYHKNLRESFQDEEVFYRNEDSNSIEFVANQIASNLLMPAESIKKAVKSGVTNLVELSNLFNVSTFALKVQLEKLGYKLK